ncbi:hypothetical protein AB0C96_31465 [Streptomyces sp. NPDC048506]|uniref:hypothetical protein n=1 Tax=Streptomyces sp. NPDC048506 TaxID=3155028 RepID=UPI00343418C4
MSQTSHSFLEGSTTMQRPKTARVAGVLAGVALAGSLLSAAAPANAADSDGSSTASSATAAHGPADGKDKDKGSGKGNGKGLCARVPELEKRINRALDRLNGDAHTRGSIARMEQRVKNARAKHHEEVATFLQDRLTHRKEMRPFLTRELTDLKAVATWCAKRDDAKGGSGS